MLVTNYSTLTKHCWQLIFINDISDACNTRRISIPYSILFTIP